MRTQHMRKHHFEAISQALDIPNILDVQGLDSMIDLELIKNEKKLSEISTTAIQEHFIRERIDKNIERIMELNFIFMRLSYDEPDRIDNLEMIMNDLTDYNLDLRNCLTSR